MGNRTLKAEFRSSVCSIPELEGLAEALESTDPEVSARWRKGLAPAGGDPVPWCPEGRYLAERPRFTLDPAMHQGLYYAQDASSMFISHILRHIAGDAPVALLDACAAPGGKATAAIDSLPEGSLVVANEYVPARAAILKENIIKWGYEGAVVTRGDTARLSRLREAFDIIVVDAPCSGEGMMRKDDQAIAQWSPGLVKECAARQREILDNLWPALKPGGFIIYSTCTFNTSENEDIARYIIDSLGAESIEIPVSPEWGISPAIGCPNIHCLRFLPGRSRGEGLFITVARKTGEAMAAKESKSRKAKESKPNPAITALLGRIDYEGMAIFADGDEARAFPQRWMPLLGQIRDAADVAHAGIAVGELAGREYAPTQSLALSRRLKPGAFPAVEVSRDTALDYLRRQAVALPPEAPRGYVLLTFGAHPLGFVKNLGNRANNLYPKQWRILNC